MTLTTKTQDILDKIHQRGYWRVVIRPTQFKKHRLELKDCKVIVTSSAVHLRAWDYPHVNGAKITRGSDWVESSYDGTPVGLLHEIPHVEYWRFFQSGQFVHHFACTEDLSAERWAEKVGRDIGSPKLYIPSTVHTVTEIFEFAARLTSKGVLVPAAEIMIKLMGMEGRELMQPGVMTGVYESNTNEISFNKLYPSDALLSKASELALDAVEFIFERFDFSPSRPDREFWAADQQHLLQRNL